MDNQLKACLLNLYQIGAIKFGTYKLKSGVLSPFYIDLRAVISSPQLLRQIAELIWQRAASLPFERLCAVPYGALPFATAISLMHNIPMLFRRKEAKAYGTKKMIEGNFQEGHRCLVIDDLITSGLSLFETIAPLEEVGLQVKDTVVFLDRQQGGKEAIQAKGYNLHSVVTITHLLTVLQKEDKITAKKVEEIQSFLQVGSC